MVLKTTSNKTEVRKEGGCPPLYPLATTLMTPIPVGFIGRDNYAREV
jgi:hypothetical protein